MKDNQLFVNIFNGYKHAALWSSSDQGEESLQSFEFSEQAESKLMASVMRFVGNESDLIALFCEQESVDFAQVGHIFWLATNGHGCGFFDFSGTAAKELDAKCDQYLHYGAIYGGFDLYIGDDRKIYC